MRGVVVEMFSRLRLSLGVIVLIPAYFSIPLSFTNVGASAKTNTLINFTRGMGVLTFRAK